MQAKINDVLYNLPLEVSEIKLGDFLPFNREYQKYVDLQNAESPERDIIKQMVKCIAAFFKCDIRDVKKSSYSSIEVLFNYLTNVITKFKIQDKEVITFDYKGEHWTLHNLTNKDSTVSESIELLEAQRILSNNRSKKNIKESDYDSYLFTEIITVISVLAIKEDDIFPETQSEIDKFIESRQKHFVDIDMCVGLTAAFFFGGIVKV